MSEPDSKPAGVTRTEAREAFLSASVAVWREIDRLDAEPDGYHPIRMSVELRQRERAAWERYRDMLAGGPDQDRTDEDGSTIADMRPDPDWPGHWSVTCGHCDEEFGTNFRVEEIECPECESRRCPHCKAWFGAES